MLIASAALGSGCGLYGHCTTALEVRSSHEVVISLPQCGPRYRPRTRTREDKARHVRRLAIGLREARAGERQVAVALREARARQYDAMARRDEARTRDREVLIADSRRRGGGYAPAGGSRKPRVKLTLENVPRRVALPPGVDGEVFSAIQDKLTREFPWLRELTNGEAIITLYALRIAWTREAVYAARKRNALPDPYDTIVSAERRARARKRAPWERRRLYAARLLQELPNNVRIKLSELRSDDFTDVPTNMEAAGRRGMLEELDRHRGSVGLYVNHMGRVSVGVYIDGTELPLRDGRLHFDVFFGTTAVALLEVQKAYHTSKLRTGRAELRAYYAKHPWVAGVLMEQRFEGMIGDQVLARLDREMGLVSIEQEYIDGMRQERRQRAEAIRQRVAGAMVPMTMIASLFAVEGMKDVFLQAFPAGRAADMLRELVKLRRAGKIARKLDELPQVRYFRDALDRRQARFLRGIEKLSVRQRRALLEIGEKITAEKYPDVMIALAERAHRGYADLAWIQSKLRKGHFDGDLVKNFTRYDANPTWRQLQRLLDNKQLARETRMSLISKLKGFRGEEAAEALVDTPGFRNKFSRDGKKFIVSRGDGSLDIFARTDDNSAIVFAEVKNWSGAKWLKSGSLHEVKDQLLKHNERIPGVLKKEQLPAPPDGIHKLLMVEESGWMLLEDGIREEFKQEIWDLGGWKIQIIPGSMVEEPGEFIDRLRKPTSK